MLAALAGMLPGGPTTRAAAADPPCEFDGIERIVAVGDVQGAYDRLMEILKTAAVIDARGRWSGGKTHLVQLGDVVDRGPDSRKAIDFYRRLEKDANSAGGRVHYLLGNHEAMRLLRDPRYITPGEYEAFVTGDSKNLRQQLVETVPENQRAKLLADTPLGMIELIQAFSPKGAYGSYFVGLNAVVRLNGIMFMHGGLSPSVAAMPCLEINTTVRRELSADLDKTRADPQASLVAREDGPLWYRGLAQEPDTFGPEVVKILEAARAKAIVVAHTVQTTSRVGVRFDGKVFLMDTGMQQQYVKDGRASALEIRGGTFTAIYVDGKQVLTGG
jgi:Calcineurin-like phosphoesterase